MPSSNRKETALNERESFTFFCACRKKVQQFKILLENTGVKFSAACRFRRKSSIDGLKA